MMELHLYGALALLAILGWTFKLILYPALFSPLAKIPNAHWSCGFSPLWIVWMKWTKQENCQVYKKHMEKGPAIRLAPNLVSFNCFEDGLKTVYNGGFPKPEFYFNGFAVYGYEQDVHSVG